MRNLNDNIAEHLKELPEVPTPNRARGFLRLDLNESPSLFPPEALKDMTLTQEIMGYYPEYDNLKQKLAAYTNTDQENITVYNGSDAGIATLLTLFLDEGDTAVLPEPSFFIYRQILTARKVNIRSIPIEASNNQVTFPTSSVLQAINEGVKAVLLCNPTNPIGIAIPSNELELIVQHASASNTLVIIDEAYFEFYGRSAVALVQQHPNVMVLRTMSKGFGLAGLRIGYSITHPGITKHIRRIQLPWAASNVSTMIAELVLDTYQDSIAKSRRALLNRKAAIEARLQALRIDYVPSHTNFILLKLPAAITFAEAMYEKEIMVGKTYISADRYPVLANTVRVTVPSENDMQYVTEAIEKSYADST